MRRQQERSILFTKRKNAHTADLVTQSEATFNSQSQIDQHSTSTQNMSTQYQKSKTTTIATAFKGRDDIDDIIPEQCSTLFINPQEEEVIRSVFELARKGKINPGNAFEIPLKVLTTSQSGGQDDMHFWKFASQLLHTSMFIYDKRVENVFITSNSIADTLTRNKSRQLEQAQQLDLKKRRECRKSQKTIYTFETDKLDEMREVTSLEIRNINTEEPARLSLKKNKIFFSQDPLFQKKLQLFDNSNLNGLFLNFLQIGPTHEIRLFETGESLPDQTDQQIENSQDSHHYPNDRSFKKSSLILRNHHIFLPLSKFINIQGLQKTNSRFDQDQFELIKKSFEQLEERIKEPFLMDDDVTQLSFHSASSFHSTMNINGTSKTSDHSYLKQIGMPQEPKEYLTSSVNFAQNPINRNLLGQQECHTVMTPWQIEFKGLKLNVLKAKQFNKKLSKPSNLNNQQIDLTMDIEGKSEVIQAESEVMLSVESKVTNNNFLEKNLVFKSMFPFVEIIKNKIPDLGKDKTLITPCNPSKYNQIGMPSHMDNPFLTQSFLKINMIDISQTKSLTIQPQGCEDAFSLEEPINLLVEDVSTQGLKNIKTFGLRNIRDIKELILNQVTKRKLISLGQINYSISPAGLFILFLHLVNQQNLVITSTEDGSNAELSLN